VQLERGVGVVRVAVADDGIGGAELIAGSGSGLAGLRDRLDALDAELVVESVPRVAAGECVVDGASSRSCSPGAETPIRSRGSRRASGRSLP
jgi:glucose-6-phosphate-specific signal transduction histidine kinase